MAMTHYHGGCQCGAVQYEVDVDLDRVLTCNCSRCQRLGSVLAFTPEANFKLKKGEGAQTEYLFNRKAIHHLFCKTCGIESYMTTPGRDGTPMVAVNVNCLEGVDPRALKAKHVDGKSW